VERNYLAELRQQKSDIHRFIQSRRVFRLLEIKTRTNPSSY